MRAIITPKSIHIVEDNENGLLKIKDKGADYLPKWKEKNIHPLDASVLTVLTDTVFLADVRVKVLFCQCSITPRISLLLIQ